MYAVRATSKGVPGGKDIGLDRWSGHYRDPAGHHDRLCHGIAHFWLDR